MKKKTKIIIISVVSILVLVALITVLVIVIRNNQLIDKGNKLFRNDKCSGYKHGDISYRLDYADLDLHGDAKSSTLKIVKSKYNKCKICNNNKKEDINIICDYCAWITGRCPECGGLIK